MSRRARTLLVAGLSLLLIGGFVRGAAAQQQRANLPDIEDEVMCTICGTLLEESQSPQADRERALIRRLIAQGKTKQEIKDALVAQYGDQVLATPGTSGFDLFAWLVPGLGLLLGLVVIALVWRRTRRRGAGPSPPALSREDSDRIDADLAKFDP
jgi:cytochrome c-type biogenesis protein CcmH